MFDRQSAQQGWQCPVCNRVYAPWMASCPNCGGERQTISTTISQPLTELDFIKMYGMTPEQAIEEAKKVEHRNT